MVTFDTDQDEDAIVDMSFLDCIDFLSIESCSEIEVHDHSNTQVVPSDYFESISDNYPDTSQLYKTDQAFDSKNEARDWCVGMGKKNNCVIVTPDGVCRKRNEWTTGKGSRFELGCERGGVHRIRGRRKNGNVMEEPRGKKRKADTGTKKKGCPFKISVLCGADSKWRITVRNGQHNHDPPESLVGHHTSTLSETEYCKVVKMYNDGAKPATILTAMKREFPGIVCHIKTIYNAIQKSNKISGDGRTSFQEFMHLCAENHYIVRKRTNMGQEVTDLFFAHPQFADLANTFHDFVILDNTYKTNLYDMPLLNVVSHTSTRAQFTVALCFMQFEREDNFVWALEKLKELYLYDNVPNVFLTDCDQALINAVKIVFPLSTHLLCIWHINKDMMAYCKPIINPPVKKKKKKGDEENGKVEEVILKEQKPQSEIDKANKEKRQVDWLKFKDDWTSVCNSRTEEVFDVNYKGFEAKWIVPYGKAFRYCDKQWFKPHKKKFVAAWTNKVKHFDNHATSLVESSHGRVKSYAVSSKGSFPTFFKAVHRMFDNDLTRLLQQFEISKTQNKWRYAKEPIFKLLIGNVSHFAMRSLMLEKQYPSMIGSDKDGCICTIKLTMGLPCSHVMQTYCDKREPIPLSVVDPFWRKMSLRSVNRIREEKGFSGLSVLIDIKQR
ncbi:hypothetical protein MKW94_007850 [Papaver nudicaule]|uniref:MULE transposase domain-containing protein n=1 Tax=Papaver nudicaule TaxID=74823 RepID=A0AA41S3C9_PAPNU|nr:hypothetical protein [Papaver nudicaule]